MKATWIILLIGFLGFLIVVTMVRFSLILATVAGQSMLPTLKANDRILLLRYWPLKWLYRGQIIMLRNPALSGTNLTHEFRNNFVGNLFLVKRITHVPGDTYPMESGSSFSIETLAMPGGKIPQGYVLIASDNPVYNTTNKSVIPFKDIVGVMIMKLPNDSLNLNPKR